MDDGGIQLLSDDDILLSEPGENVSATYGSDAAESSNANGEQSTELVSTGATAQDVEKSCQGVRETITEESAKVVTGIDKLTDSVNSISMTLSKEDTRNEKQETTYTVVLDASQVQTIEAYGRTACTLGLLLLIVLSVLVGLTGFRLFVMRWKDV